MALFHKLFISGRNQNKSQESVSDKIFAFSKEQVRVMLFRECDFRGRKLLFDSDAVKKVPLDSTSNAEFNLQHKEKVTFANGHGYKYSKPHPEFNQLVEMIFGTVAMSFRGTYFKIHSLSSPQRLMFTQVFPTPHHASKKVSSSCSSQSQCTSTYNSEHSIKLDDSGASSTNSISEQLSVHSTASDTLLVYRRQPSTPVDVPKHILSVSNPSIIGDSGCGADHSYSSFSSGPDSFPAWDNLVNSGTFSSSGDYRKWLRSTSTSLEHSGTSLTGSASTDDNGLKAQHRSKLGLALIIQITPGQEESLVQFLMEHVALIEAILWRSRRKVETAHCRPQSFLPLMLHVAESSAQWILNLLSGPFLSNNLWLSLSCTCDNNNSISAFNMCALDSMATSNSCLNMSGSLTHLSGGYLEKTSFFGLSSFFKRDTELMHEKKCSSVEERSSIAEKFLREFCELLDAIDVKSTNFFMSTLLTAVLTHHLGWVATCLPANKRDTNTELQLPFNMLWGQLTDLFGAVGHPTKMAQTILAGTNKKDITKKIITSLTYFIRCCDVERKFITRLDVEEENKIVENICLHNSCIPKENYKKYEDHLKEMMDSNPFSNEKIVGECFEHERKGFSQIASESLQVNSSEHHQPKKSGLTRSHTCVKSLSVLGGDFESAEREGCEKNVKFLLGDSCINETVTLGNLFSVCSLQALGATPLTKDVEDEECGASVSSGCVESKTDCENKICGTDSNEKSVVFVLGDNDELVGLKKDSAVAETLMKGDTINTCPKSGKLKRVKSSKQLKLLTDQKETVVGSGVDKKINKRPSFINLELTKHEFFRDEDFRLQDLPISSIKPSTSWNSLDMLKEDNKDDSKTEFNPSPTLPQSLRSHSVPPEERKEEKPDLMKSKYRYGGYKFTLQQYPQILENYLRSKNLEIASFQFSSSKSGIKQFGVLECGPDYTAGNTTDDEEMETLQTPSNASEMEFTSDLMIEIPRVLNARESSVEPVPQYVFVRPADVSGSVNKDNVDHKRLLRKLSSCDCTYKTDKKSGDIITSHNMKIVNMPMPKSVERSEKEKLIPYTSSLMRDVCPAYLPDVVLQGTSLPKTEWESRLKNDLLLSSQHSLLDAPLEEAVAIVANLDTWDVQLMSSHTYVIDKGSSGIRVGMSQLVASMLESLLHMWKLKATPDFCLMHIEQRLQEVCVRSQALAQLLLASEFCSMEHLTSTLHLEVNDVPLLMAVASVHSPQLTQKYGLTFL